MSGTESIIPVLFLAGVCISGACSVSQAQIVSSSAGPLSVETFARGLDHPWAIAFLPDSRLLVTERPGRMAQCHFSSERAAFNVQSFRVPHRAGAGQ
jgi:glucose/arabinose dehydrogenase